MVNEIKIVDLSHLYRFHFEGTEKGTGQLTSTNILPQMIFIYKEIIYSNLQGIKPTGELVNHDVVIQ